MCNLFDIVRVEVLCFDGEFIDFNLDVALRFVENVAYIWDIYVYLPVTHFSPIYLMVVILRFLYRPTFKTYFHIIFY